ncbi:MAG: sigma-70 family RNA polymerase sigma factor [Planctomycetales bacterium]|nr:sigma-70 family RNA polymerase sigma factor [Planctomycetales bacterium]
MLYTMEDDPVNDLPETRDSLIARVKDARDDAAWHEFSEIYRPVVYRLARSHGLQDADAQDLSQRVLFSVAQAIPKWQPHGGGIRFRHWLSRVAKNALINALTRQPRDQADGGSDAFRVLNLQTAPGTEQERQIDWEYRRQVFRRAADLVRSRADEQTWLAFSATMIDGLSIADAAANLKLSEGSIYAARSRIIRRLRDAVRQLEDQ